MRGYLAFRSHRSPIHQRTHLTVRRRCFVSSTMTDIDDSELWISEEEDGGDMKDEDISAYTPDPTFFVLELGHAGQTGGKSPEMLEGLVAC